MGSKTLNKGQWLITEGDSRMFHLYRLIEGRVSIHSKGKKINEVEVKPGGTPRVLGILALFNDRKPTASVRAETDVEVETPYMDHIMGLIRNELPLNRDDLSAVIESIELYSAIERARGRLAEIGTVKLSVPAKGKGEVREVFNELKELYETLSAREKRK